MQPYPISLCPQCRYAAVSLSPPANSSRNTMTPDIGTLRDYLFEPTVQNAGITSQWLLEARRELAQYDKEIDRLRSHLSKLEDDRNQFQQCIDRWAALAAPVRRLPTEVLVEIFSLSCLEDTEEDFGFGSRGASLMYPSGRMALRLSLVCTRWRSVALGTPRIWSHINVSLCGYHDLEPMLCKPGECPCLEDDILWDRIKAHPIEDIVHVYLKRSRSHPLAINVSRPSTICTCDDAQWPTAICDTLLTGVFDILSEESRRWRSARINFSPRWDFEPGSFSPESKDRDHLSGDENASGVELDIPSLEVLDINPGLPDDVIFCNVFRLHTLAVRAPTWGEPLDDESLFQIPGLRSLTLRQFTVCDFEKILSQLPEDGPGVDVRFEGFYHTDFRVFQCEIYEAPAIKSISVILDESGPRSLENLCSLLTAKHATKLELVYRPQEQEQNNWWYLKKCPDIIYSCIFPHEAVVGMIERSAMPLTILKIDGFVVTDDALLKILRLVPSVEELSVAETRLRDEKARVREVDLGDKDEGCQKVAGEVDMSEYLSDGNRTISRKLLRRLTYSSCTASSESKHPTLLSNLKTFRLTFRPRSQVRDLMNMVHSRWRAPGLPTLSVAESRSERGVASLNSVAVTLIFDSEPETRSTYFEKFQDGLSELKNAGFDIQYKVMVY